MRKAHNHLLGSIQSLFLYIFVLTTCIFSLFVLTANAAGETGAEISLAWDRNGEPDLKGYKIYYKTGSSGEPYDGKDAHEGSSPITIYLNEFQDPNAPSYKLTELLHGETYYLTLTAFNNEDVESDFSNEVGVTTNIVIVNDTPTANAGMDQTKDEGATVYLDGANSSDPEDNIVSYKWRQTSGPSVNISNSTQAKARFTAPDVSADGASLLFELTVTDAEGLTDSDICIVNVSWLNVAPAADAGGGQTVKEGETVTLSGKNSTDADDAILIYKWTQMSGPVVTLLNDNSMQPYFIAPDVDENGASLTFNLKVTDEGGLAASDTCVVNVSWLNEAPTAVAGADKVAFKGDTVILNGSGSSDPENGIERFMWIQKSGQTVSLSNSSSEKASFLVSDSIPDGSALFFELTVTDRGGLQTSDTCIVEIKASVQDTPDNIDDTKDNTQKDNTPNNNKENNNGGSDTNDPSPSVVIPDNNGNGNKKDTFTDQGKELGNNKKKKTDEATSDPTTDMDVTNEDPVIVDKTNPTDEEKEDGIINNPKEDTEIIETVENEAPYQPETNFPVNGALVSAGFQLTTGGFMDPDAEDAHLQTQWQIFDKANGICVLNMMSSSYLTAISVPEMMLNEETNYYWRARFYDNHGKASEWSMNANFATPFSGKDADGNGVPDIQDPDISVDLDGDAIPDIEQEHIRSIALPNSEQHIGLSIENCPTVDGILTMEAIDPANTSIDIEQEADVLPYGLINFKLDVCNVGDVAKVTVFFEKPAPVGAKWVKYNQVQDLWVDYSSYATFSNDRMSIVLEFKDGGYGDDDGIENGIIVDPSGLEVLSDSQTSYVEPTSSTESVVQASGGGGGGCFIASTSDAVGHLHLMHFLVFFLAALVLSFFKPRSVQEKSNN
jgi:chitinase